MYKIFSSNSGSISGRLKKYSFQTLLITSFSLSRETAFLLRVRSYKKDLYKRLYRSTVPVLNPVYFPNIRISFILSASFFPP